MAKDETPSSSKPASKATAASKTSANVSPVTEDEIRTVLLAVAPVTTQDLVSRFKSRLRGPEVGFVSFRFYLFWILIQTNLLNSINHPKAQLLILVNHVEIREEENTC